MDRYATLADYAGEGRRIFDGGDVAVIHADDPWCVPCRARPAR